MAIPAASAVLSALAFLLPLLSPAAGSPPGVVGVRKFVIDDGISAPWAEGLLKLQGAPAQAPDARYPLVLAAKSTKRPDMLNKFRLYRGGWDITNKHYWASVAFTGAAGFVLAFLWFVIFGLALGAYHCCKWGTGMKGKATLKMQRTCLMLLLVFTCAAVTGCILLSVGQNEFHDEVLNTLGFVVNQSDFTVQILRNVTGFLSYAKTVNVAGVYLPSDVQNEIDKLNIDLSGAATTLTEKTNENSVKVRRAIYYVWCALIAVAVLMLILAILGFVLSFLGHKHAIYLFIISGWLLVAVTFVLCGVFLILNNAVADTCTAMDEWAHYPKAETALSNILPCVDEQTTNATLYRSRFVIRQLVNVINTAILSIANSNTAQWDQSSFFYNQSGPLIPSLCSPYDSQLHDRSCEPQEVSFANASVMSRKGKSVAQPIQVHVDDEGIPIEPSRTSLVIAITRQVIHCDNFSPCISWPDHKKSGRVEQLWKDFKDAWGLPDKVETKKWFNTTANNRWSDYKSRILKKIFDDAPDIATAKARRPDGVISAPMWEQLCNQFAKISDPRNNLDGKSKSEKCREARKSVALDHHWGRSSIKGWNHKHLQETGSIPTAPVIFDKGYMRIDPLSTFGPSSTDENNASPQQRAVVTNPQVLQISENLHKTFEEAIRDGSDMSTANTLTCQKVLGKTNVLGIDSSKQTKVSRVSRMWNDKDAQINALKEQVRQLQQEAQEKDKKAAKKSAKLERSLQSIVAHFKEQGIILDDPTSTETDEDEEENVL